MEIDIYENDQHKVLLTNDYSPNHAMINEFQTVFFTCKLKRIELLNSQLQGYEVEADARFMKLHMQIKNITNEILSMYKDDFNIIYDNAEPYEPEDYFHVDKQYPDEYALKPLEELHGCLVFIIPKSASKLCLSYTEYFDDESEGKTYRLKYKIK